MNWEELEKLNKQCNICLEQTSYNKDIICGLKCSCDITKYDAKYHKDCIIKWIRKKGTCPYCRSNANIRYLDVRGYIYYPKTNYDDIFFFDYETIVESNKKIDLKFEPIPFYDFPKKSS